MEPLFFWILSSPVRFCIMIVTAVSKNLARGSKNSTFYLVRKVLFSRSYFVLPRPNLCFLFPFSASFAPACLSHEIITRKWVLLQILWKVNRKIVVLTAWPLWYNLYGLSFQSLDRHPGEGDIITPCPALLGSEPTWEQQKWEGPSERLPNSSDWQLSMASLQPLVPHYQGPVHRAGDECDPVPHAHGFWCSEDGTATGPGAQ